MIISNKYANVDYILSIMSLGGKQTMLDQFIKKKQGLLPNHPKDDIPKNNPAPKMWTGGQRDQWKTQQKHLSSKHHVFESRSYHTQQKTKQEELIKNNYHFSEYSPGLLRPLLAKDLYKQPAFSHKQRQQAKVNHQSSSETIMLDIDPSVQQTTIKCPQYILIGPFDTIFSQKMQSCIENLMVECTKENVMEFIKNRLTALNLPTNLQNLGQLKDDHFWCIHLQNIIGLLLHQQHQINARISLLPYVGVTESVSFTRLQVFMLVSSMFLCMIPAQAHTDLTSFYQLMAIRPNDKPSKIAIRLQKLKCIINYLKFMSQHSELYSQKLSFQRATNYDQEYLCDNTIQPVVVDIKIGKIEEGYGKGVLIDFANASVGGGFLKNGCAQEQILFSIFPQLSIIKLICPDIKEQQAIVVRGARRFNQYEGYSDSFKFRGNYQGPQPSDKSVIVAVDAIDYTKGLLTKQSQFSKLFIKKELRKFFVGVNQALQAAGPYPKPERIFTGRWGCGVFGADEYLKFCIQWIICSFLRIPMTFFTIDKQTKAQLEVMTRKLSSKSTIEILSLIEFYCISKNYKEKGLLNYFKYHA